VHSFVKGWMVCATFQTRGQGDKCDKGTNSQPAHIFQQEYVLPEVYRHILSERWKVECTQGAMSGLPVAASSKELRAIERIAAPKINRYGAGIRRNPALLIPVASGVGLGAEGALQCFQEGIFSNIASADEIMNDKIKLGAGVFAGAVGAYLLWKAATRSK
jgi:hypothetical protein